MSVSSQQQIWTEVTEEYAQVLVEVEGSLPAWLQGTLVRTGPVRVSVDGQSPSHWFDGLSMLHAFSFDNGHVHYSNKFMRTDAYHAVFNEGSIHYTGFVSDPCRSLFRRFLTYLLPHSFPLNNTNVNVDCYASHYIAMTEIPLPIRFGEDTLDTLGVLDYADELPKEYCFESAHPHHDPVSRE